MTLTHTQMLALWRRAAGMEESRSDCSIEQFEGLDLDAALATAMRQWYLRLLDTADLRHLVITDISSRLSLTRTAPGVWQAQLPVDVRRVLTVETASALCPLSVIDGASDKPEHQRSLALQANPFSRAGSLCPLASLTADVLTIYCMPDSETPPSLRRVAAVIDPGDEIYEFNESALGLLPNPINKDLLP